MTKEQNTRRLPGLLACNGDYKNTICRVGPAATYINPRLQRHTDFRFRSGVPGGAGPTADLQMHL